MGFARRRPRTPSPRPWRGAAGPGGRGAAVDGELAADVIDEPAEDPHRAGDVERVDPVPAEDDGEVLEGPFRRLPDETFHRRPDGSKTSSCSRLNFPGCPSLRSVNEEIRGRGPAPLPGETSFFHGRRWWLSGPGPAAGPPRSIRPFTDSTVPGSCSPGRPDPPGDLDLAVREDLDEEPSSPMLRTAALPSGDGTQRLLKRF